MSSSPILQFLTAAGRLKQLPRTGWLQNNIPNPESVADHSFRLSLFALSFGHLIPGVDVSKAVFMSIVHDLAESIVGDITPHDTHISKEQKLAMELSAIQQLTKDLPSDLSHTVSSLFYEYEDQSSPTAVFVKLMDKFEMILTAAEYENQHDLPLCSFFDSVTKDMKGVDDKVLIEIFEGIKKMRKF
ncbi:hypothetical protein GEMRC1_013360 [Eukaryota sp. GEM-RC1]